MFKSVRLLLHSSKLFCMTLILEFNTCFFYYKMTFVNTNTKTQKIKRLVYSQKVSFNDKILWYARLIKLRFGKANSNNTHLWLKSNPPPPQYVILTLNKYYLFHQTKSDSPICIDFFIHYLDPSFLFFLHYDESKCLTFVLVIFFLILPSFPDRREKEKR